MFTRTWSTSERKYDVTVDRDVKVRMPDGTLLDGVLTDNLGAVDGKLRPCPGSNRARATSRSALL